MLEGGEGSGKSTQAKLLADALGAVATFEPGRHCPRRWHPCCASRPCDRITGRSCLAEALLMAADRAQHVAEVIRPCSNKAGTSSATGTSDRRSRIRGTAAACRTDWMRGTSAWATGGLTPDLTVLLDVPADVAAARASDKPDRFESAGERVRHRRVVEGYRALAADPTWVIVDGGRTVDEVAVAARARVRDRLQL